MAKYRLLLNHELEIHDRTQRLLLPGDKENEHLGDEKGTIVGDGTPYRVEHATLFMAALDAEGEAALDAERERLQIFGGSMNPIDQLPLHDDYEERYIPGMDGVQRGAVARPQPAAPAPAPPPPPPRTLPVAPARPQPAAGPRR